MVHRIRGRRPDGHKGRSSHCEEYKAHGTDSQWLRRDVMNPEFIFWRRNQGKEETLRRTGGHYNINSKQIFVFFSPLSFLVTQWAEVKMYLSSSCYRDQLKHQA